MKEQKSFFEITEEDLQKAKEVAEEKLKRYCGKHYYADAEKDFIEVENQKTGEKTLRCRYCEHVRLKNVQAMRDEWKYEKDNLTDFYIKFVLKSGKNGLKLREIPPSLIEAQRAVLQLKHLKEKIDEKRVVKKCSTHGNLFEEDVIKSGFTKAGRPSLKCKKCMSLAHKKNYELNKVKILLKNSLYRKDNQNKVKECKRKWKQKYINKKIEERLIRDYVVQGEENNDDKKMKERMYTRTLTDGYIKRRLNKNSNLNPKDIPYALVDAKRALLLLKRKVKRKREDRIFNTLKEKLNGKP